MTTNALYITNVMPQPSEAPDEFAIDADILLKALMIDPHEFFSRIPELECIRDKGMKFVNGMVSRKVFTNDGVGYTLIEGCPTCQQRLLTAGKRSFAMSMLSVVGRLWNDIDKQRSLREHMNAYFSDRFPEIVSENKSIVINIKTAGNNTRKLIIRNKG